jgi:uncharacterized membrane protein
MDLLNTVKQTLDFSLPLLGPVAFLRAALGLLLVFFLPGFTWTLIFFRRVAVIERVVLSAGLSIALVTLVVCALNLLLGVKISGLNSLLTIVAIAVIPVILYCILRFRKTHKAIQL